MKAGDPAERYVRAGGFATRYLEAGRRQGTPVVLVHDGAWGGCSSVCWSEVMSSLAEEFWVLAPDLLGFGGTDKVVFLDRSPYKFRIDHLFDFLTALHIEVPVHLVGTSFGGSLVLRALAGAEANRVAKAVSIAGSGRPSRNKASHEGLVRYDGTEADMARIVRLLVDDFAGLDEYVAARQYWATRPGHYRAMMALRVPDPTSPKRAGSREQWPEPLRAVSTPVLLIAGKDDVLLEPDWPEPLLDCLSNARAVELKCRHAPNIDRPGEVAAVLSGFFQDG